MPSTIRAHIQTLWESQRQLPVIHIISRITGAKPINHLKWGFTWLMLGVFIWFLFFLYYVLMGSIVVQALFNGLGCVCVCACCIYIWVSIIWILEPLSNNIFYLSSPLLLFLISFYASWQPLFIITSSSLYNIYPAIRFLSTSLYLWFL